MSERQPSKAERARVERWYDKMCRETNAALEERDRAVAENAQLKTELGAARAAYERRTAERNLANEERDAARAEVERMKAAYRELSLASIRQTEKHQVLSEIIRARLTPEQYHEAREDVRHYYGI